MFIFTIIYTTSSNITFRVETLYIDAIFFYGRVRNKTQCNIVAILRHTHLVVHCAGMAPILLEKLQFVAMMQVAL